MKKNMIVAMVLGAVVIAGGSFWAGMSYASSKAPARGQFAGGAGGTGGGRINMRGTANGGFVSGEVVAADASSVTVKTQDGSTKIVLVAPSTQVLKSTTGAITDLSSGTMVVVTGTPNADGSISAQTVQIRPAGSPMGGPRSTRPQ